MKKKMIAPNSIGIKKTPYERKSACRSDVVPVGWWLLLVRLFQDMEDGHL